MSKGRWNFAGFERSPFGNWYSINDPGYHVAPALRHTLDMLENIADHSSALLNAIPLSAGEDVGYKVIDFQEFRELEHVLYGLQKDDNPPQEDLRSQVNEAIYLHDKLNLLADAVVRLQKAIEEMRGSHG